MPRRANSRRRWLFAAAAAVGGWELGWWVRRYFARKRVFDCARARSLELHRPLVLVGAPDQGPTNGTPCGDVTVDIADSSCAGAVRADITKPLPFETNSVVVVVACTLEYVDDYEAAMAELLRVSGGPQNLFIVRVEPWTLTAYLYPGRRRVLPAAVARVGC